MCTKGAILRGLCKAFNRGLDRIVALKILSPEMRRRDPEMVRRTIDNARLTAMVEHPNLVRIFHVGEESGWSFVEMEFVDGLDLARVLHTRQLLPVAQVVNLVTLIGGALAAVHAAGLIHGCVAAEKVLLRNTDDPRLAGFAGASGGAECMAENLAETPLEELACLAPEVLQGREISARADIYSLGVTFFRAAAGRMPFTAHDRTELIRQQYWERTPDPCEINPRIPRMLGDIILRMLAKTPAARFTDMTEFLDAISTAIATEGGPRLAYLMRGTIVSQHPVTNEPVVIGRDAACTISIDDERTSRRHTRIFMRNREVGMAPASAAETFAVVHGREVVAEDMKSSNGTFVNGHRVLSQTLVPGDIIRVGRRHFVYMMQGMPLKRSTADAVGWLHGIAADGAPIDLPVSRAPILFGRAQEVDVRIEDRGATDLVGQVVAVGRKAQWINLTSEMPSPVEIDEGDALKVGSLRLVFYKRPKHKEDSPRPAASALKATGPVRPDESHGLAVLLSDEASRMDQLIDTDVLQPDTPPPPSSAGRPKVSVLAGRCIIAARFGPLQGQSFPIGRTDLLIGSTGSSGICLPDPLVSKCHARIRRSEGVPMIEDAGSRSGVVVNGRRIKMHPLKPGDTIVIGSTEFLVHL